MASQRKLVPLGIAAVGLAVYFFLSPRMPADQSIRVVLGDGAPRVVELVVRYVGPGPTMEPLREVTFRYAPGAAPRIVSHEPRLPNGDYVVQMELSLSPPLPASQASQVSVERKVTLQGGTTSLDISRTLLRPAEEP